MEKRVVSSLEVHKKKPMKRNKKKILFKKVVEYLKSDSYMFAHLLSSQPSDFSPTKTISTVPTVLGIETKKPTEENKKQLLGKVEEFLKSDCYMYAPLIVPQQSHYSATNSVSPHKGQVSNSEKVASTISMNKVTEKTEQPVERTVSVVSDDKHSDRPYRARGSVVRRTIVHRETVTHAVHHNCRSSSVPGKGLLDTEPRKLVVE